MQYFKKNGNSKHLITRRTKICDHLRMVTREMNVRIQAYVQKLALAPGQSEE